MCAIAGILDLPAPTATVEAMRRTMVRRGPDGFGVFHDADVTMLHARLAVIDPDGGQQPMTLDYQGESYTIIYNGELNNTEELRSELMKLGHSFRGHSDTEVLLHGCAQWGRGVTERLNGIYAFALWEHRNRRLLLVRDRIGVKPLFYKLHAGGFLFASEIKTILAYPSVNARLDETGARQLILLGPGRLPGSGVFRDIRELELLRGIEDFGR